MNILKKGFMFLSNRGFFDSMSDEKYLKLRYKCILGKKLNLNNPITYNEKLQWLKLYDRKSEYTKMVDKYEVKKYVSDIIGDEHIIPTLGVWDNADDINFDALPNEFVLKCTHDSGGIVICNDKSQLDIQNTKTILNHFLNRNFYSLHREWPYKNVKPRIIAEKYMVDESGYELKDYKFFCFDGKVNAMFIATDRNEKTETCFDFFDRDFNHMPVINGHPNTKKTLIKPQGFEKMIELAEKLSIGIPQVRIDFYDINGKVYFGEMTFFHWSGLKKFEPEKYDKIFGDWIALPNKTVQE
ncbi:MAG: glycosyl transferase [Eubacterium sp.]|nr:glycosyl transferase [Eubacterium sp.]